MPFPRLIMSGPSWIDLTWRRGRVSELQLLRIWQAVLAVGGIGITDNFFDLGGNSLAALYLLTHINKAFSKKLPLAALYQAQTVEELAALLDNDNLSVSWSFPDSTSD